MERLWKVGVESLMAVFFRRVAESSHDSKLKKAVQEYKLVPVPIA